MSGTAEAAATLGRHQWRQAALITLAALAVFVALRLLPTGTNLSHMDFRVDPKAGNAIEFCDPLNPQFIPVVSARSPVTLAVSASGPVVPGRETKATVTLKTGSGKPVTPEDLLNTHTRRLHLLIVDPTLRDYQHVHPDPTRTAGEWAFSFTPHATGAYRIFADFTPAATGRGLYASADLAVVGQVSDLTTTSADSARETSQVGDLTYSKVVRDGVEFALATTPQPARAGKPIDLSFSMARPDGGPVALELVMGAYAHLVAFDQARSGFAHLHPTEIDLAKPPDAKNPLLNFKLTIPRAGRYVVWSQLKMSGREIFVPFSLEVVE